MAVTAVLLLLYVAMLAAFSRSGFPSSMVSASHWPSLIDKPVGEDGYYMLTVSDNIATKGHILYNRGLPATGIQPLATMLFAGLDWTVRHCGGGTDALIRSVMMLGALLLLVLAFQISRIAAELCRPAYREHAALLAFMLTASSFTLFRLFTYGLETGLYLVLVAACFQITLRIAAQKRASLRDVLLLGVAAGLAGETRIDFGILFAMVLAVSLFYRWLTLRQAAAAGGIALLLVSPWFAFVHKVSGSWLPTSGKAESTLIAWNTLGARAGTMVLAVAGEVMPWCYAVVSHLTIAIAMVSGLIVALLLVFRGKYRTAWKNLLLSEHSRLWLSCLLLLFGIYLVFFNATHFYYRYVAPLAILTLPACAILMVQSAWIRRHVPAVSAALWTVFACWAAGSLHTGHIGNSQTIAAGYVHEYYPQAHVGAFQSGVMGFFNRNVENLDGKLNQGALKASAKHQLPQFIDAEGIDVLVDWPIVLHADLPSTYLRDKWEPCPVPIGGGAESICLIRKTSEAALLPHQPLISAVRLSGSASTSARTIPVEKGLF